ncbi:MAG: nickel pincer cofactor biosynthesis protein LarC [Nitrospirota bacterium]
MTILKIAYFDCFSGISGDMCLGALVGAGLSIKRLEKELEGIPIRGYRLTAQRVKRSHFAATKVNVEISQNSSHRKWKDIEGIIHKSSFSKDIKQKGLKVFERIFKAEAKVHGEIFDKVHLHEVGAIDCIVDVFGTIIGLNILGVKEVYSSPVNLGKGFVETEAGILPVPAPATAEILRKVPVYSNDILFELTTPTGAAIIKELSSGFGDMPAININNIGIGAGAKDFKNWPNVLRLFIGNPPSLLFSKGGKGGFLDEKIIVIEFNIDDMNPQIYEYVMEKLFKTGALDVYLTQVIMKKGRPGIKLTVLCDEKQRENLIRVILLETSTIGLRFYEVSRKVLHREIKEVETEFGKMKMKLSRLDDILKTSPEYEDCKKIAKKLNIPLIEIIKKMSLLNFR